MYYTKHTAVFLAKYFSAHENLYESWIWGFPGCWERSHLCATKQLLGTSCCFFTGAAVTASLIPAILMENSYLQQIN